MVIKNTRSENQFCSKFAVKILRCYRCIANAGIGSLKSLHTLFDKYLDHMLVEFEQNGMVQTTWNFELLNKTKQKKKNKNKNKNKKQKQTNKQANKKLFFLKSIFEKPLTPFWKTFL